ncbi:MAG: hypothetical protein KJO17_05055 [Acidimicrobiia bacterium]|nr:hypothetical protein [Acidimicrobiia bacterium]
MVILSADRRKQRRNRRSILELDDSSRRRVRALISASRFVIQPTSDSIKAVETRLGPGSIPIDVAVTAGLGLDQTLAVTEVLASHGYEVTPHLSADHVKSPQHVSEVVRRLSRRGIKRVLVVEATGTDLRITTGAVVAQLAEHSEGLQIGVRLDPGDLSDETLGTAKPATYLSTVPGESVARCLASVAALRMRDVEQPVEVGIPGVVQAAGGGRWIDPTRTVAELGSDQGLDRLGVSGLLIDTGNHINANAAWRQQLFDLAAPGRAV